MEQTLDISWETIIKVLITCFVVYVLFLARDIVIWFFFGLIISLLLEPAIHFLQRLRLPRIVSTILVYLSIFGFLGLIVYLCAPIFILEINQFSKNIPDYFEKFNPILKDFGFDIARNFEDLTSTLVANLKDSSGGVLRAVTVFFGGVYSTFVIFTIAFFISLEGKGTGKVFSLLIPRKYEHHILSLFERAQLKVSGWFGARLLSCALVGICSFIVFFLLGIKYAFILALISGLLNFVPYVGPMITLVLSVLFVGVSSSWTMAMYILIALLVIQEVENKFLTPFLMKKFIDLPPVLVLMALLIGGSVFGFLGTVFAVPVFGIVYEFSKEFLQKRRDEIGSYSNVLE